MPDKIPNILLIHSDQHRYDCIAAHGHPLLQTPNLDRLCREGTDFSHAFTPSPICSPARACLVTGRWPSQHGCRSIPGAEVYQPARLTSTPLLPRLLVEAGYLLAHIGKWHGETADEPPGWGVADYVPEERGYDQWRAQQGIPPRVRRNGWYGEVDPHITPRQHRLAWGADHTLRCIDQFSAQENPFFIRWDPSEPHLPNLIPAEYEDFYPPELIEPWPSFADLLENKPWIQGQQRRTWQVEGWQWSDWAPVVSRYLADITLLDQQVGRLLDRLDEAGLAENTLVVYTTDHGDLCGGHGMMDKHFMMYDDVLRVPLIVRWPGVAGAGQVSDQLVCHELDLAATLCAAAGVEIPADYEGLDLAPALTGQSLPRLTVFSQYHGCQLGLYTTRMARDHRYKYVWNLTAPDEFYDLENDPGELINRAGDPECRPPLDHLQSELNAWMQDIDDPIRNDFTTHAQV